ncbi:MAG: Rieske 2Fe-2S domain-containing protein [Deltaproteobacteria bacterium]|nr:Rieske 2Fe-2S domain-containing protein [Deltaproteobacteria bacterium]
MEPKDVEDRSRRRLLVALGSLGALWAAAGLYPVYRFLSPQPPPDPFGKQGKAVVEKISPAEVARPGMGKNGGYAGRGLIVFRDAGGQLKAFDAKCTHAGCNVQFQGAKLYCNCHGGTYSLDGTNIAGPPPRPLTELRVFEENGLLYVARPTGSKAASHG